MRAVLLARTLEPTSVAHFMDLKAEIYSLQSFTIFVPVQPGHRVVEDFTMQ